MKKNEFKIDEKETLICKICDKPFLSNRLKMSHVRKEHNLSPKEYIIKIYYKNIHPQCLCGCGTKLTFTNKKTGPFFKNYTKFHNDSERIKKMKQTNLDKYGIENVFQSEKIKKKSRQTKKEKYGNENYSNPNKRKETINKKYGVDYYSKTDDFKIMLKQKRNDGCFDNVGDRLKKTKKERYGHEGYNNINKIKQTNLKKYGVDNVSNVHKIIIKKIKTYNKIFYERIKHKIQDNFDILDNENLYTGVTKNQQYKFKCKTCNNIFYDNLNNGRIPVCRVCNPINYQKSQNEIIEYIKFIYSNKIMSNTRIIIPPQELDIYIPDKKLAIEFDGLYWHSEISGNKDKNYHLNKTELCEEQEIQLIHIFEDEWLNKQEIVKRRLEHILEKSKNKIYARQCSVEEISTKDKNNFLNNYHIQGEDKSSVKLGAFYQNNLVAVMTFGKRRLALGKKNSKEGEFELIRYATSHSVTGGAGKLLSYFIKNFQPTKIISYADRRWSTGNLYEKLGFEKITDGIPNYWYIDNHQHRFHRFNFRKNILNEKLEIFDKNLTEWQNMQLNGYDRIWDCGSLKYELTI